MHFLKVGLVAVVLSFACRENKHLHLEEMLQSCRWNLFVYG